uniref:Uncharacterized protein n=1 Tax=Arundo donax TaxID=35708 RepID=A0A0A9CF27_ARUDO
MWMVAWCTLQYQPFSSFSFSFENQLTASFFQRPRIPSVHHTGLNNMIQHMASSTSTRQVLARMGNWSHRRINHARSSSILSLSLGNIKQDLQIHGSNLLPKSLD